MIDKAVRPEVRSMVRPRHGGDVWQFGSIRDYSSNVNPLGPPQRLNDYIQEAAQGLSNYPDDSAADLKQAIASRYDVRTENVIVGAGSAELIRLFPEVFVSPGDRVVMPRPTFSEYAFACQLMGARMVDLPLAPESGFRLDMAVMLSALDGAKAVYLCNPNNPTSRMVGRKDLLEIVKEAERRETMVFLDETLLELSARDEELSLVREVEGHSNLFIIRSFTKSFAMPGMRIGYGFGSKDVIRYMEAGRLTWNLGTIEQRVATRLMNDEQDHVRRAVNLLEEEKERMRSRVSRLMCDDLLLPDSYFFFAPLAKLGVGSPDFRKAMLKHGVLVRDCTSFGRPCDAYTRFCVKTPTLDEEFLSALTSAVEEIKEGRY